MSKKVISTTAVRLIAVPHFPRWNGPLGKCFRPVRTLPKKGIAYEIVVRMMKEPVRSRNAVELPMGMAPRPVATTATKSVAGTGHDSRSETLEKKPEKGTALSRARAQ